MRTYVQEHPDDTQREIVGAFGCCNQAVSEALRRLNITRKKTRRYKEQNPEEAEAYPETLEDISPEKRVYADKSGFQSYYDREYGYAPTGELRKIASRYRVLVLFLPPYSPDYNPIEKLRANMKRRLKKNMRNCDSFEEALESAIDAYF